MKTRTYTLKRRAAQQEETRARILAATIALHEELGPRNATVSAIAERAGVQRLTVYRHFPDDGALFEACTSRWLELNPPPSPERWAALADPTTRCRTALTTLYRYYRRTERMWIGAYRDREAVPALEGPMRAFEAYLTGIRDDLAQAWAVEGRPARALQATLGHAMRFATWRSLKEEGLSDAAMARLVGGWAGAVTTGAGAAEENI